MFALVAAPHPDLLPAREKGKWGRGLSRRTEALAKAAKGRQEHMIASSVRRRVLMELVVLCDQIWSNAQLLEREGFRRHLPRHSLCEEIGTPDVCQEQQLFLVEQAKETITSQNRGGQALYGDGGGYLSPWLNARRGERDAAIGATLTREMYSGAGRTWKFEVEPLERLLVEFRQRDFEGHKALISRFNHKRQLVRIEEAAAQGAPILGDRTLDKAADRLSAIQSLMLEQLSPLGYAKDKKGTKMVPLLSRALRHPWELCFSIDGTRLGSTVPPPIMKTLIEQVGGVHQTTGYLHLYCHVRHRENNKRSPGFPLLPDESQIPIRYQSTAPYFDFEYRAFDDDAQLVAAVKAHMLLYTHQHDAIVQVLDETLDTP